MFTNPLQYLTQDHDANLKIAVILASNFNKESEVRQHFYESLKIDVQKKVTYDLLYIETILSQIIVEFFKLNFLVLQEDIPKVDTWRVREKSKRILKMLQLKGISSIHEYDCADYTNSLTLDPTELLQTSSYTAYEMYTKVVEKVSEYVDHLLRLCYFLEKAVLTNTSTTNTQFEQLMSDTESVQQELKEYFRLLKSL